MQLGGFLLINVLGSLKFMFILPCISSWYNEVRYTLTK